MSENEIKPVAWVDLDVWLATSDAGDSFFTDYQDEDTVAVYDQSAIDRLTAERDSAAGKWADLHDKAVLAEAERDEAQRKLSVAVAEGKGLVAAAMRARRCLAWACEQRPEFNAEYEALDAAIDAARAEGGV